MNGTRGDWMHVYSGGRFYPLDPHPTEVHIEDIAHALSLICRYQGHTSRFYSVGEHCIRLAEAAEKRGLSVAEQLQALLHDAAEAYICDLVRPLKYQIRDYREIEYWVERAIQKRFGLLAPGKTTAIDELDNLILYDEAKALLRVDQEPWHEQFAPGLHVRIVGASPPVVEAQFLRMFRELSRGISSQEYTR